MIFYFSGTGNSFWAAKQLADNFGEKLLPVANELNDEDNLFEYNLGETERIFFVFPIHSWGPAVLIPRFIEKMKLQNYRQQSVYVVCTCGDDCGYTNRIMKELLIRKSIILTETYSLQMPNNYILMKGFGLDSKKLEKEKLEVAPKRLQEITETILSSEKKKEIYLRGKFAWIKSRTIYPLFVKYVIRRNSFYTKENCTKCGLCVKICPTKTISMQKNELPRWSDNCVQCTACLHRCPEKAIEYGKVTRNQGRYYHPEVNSRLE